MRAGEWGSMVKVVRIGEWSGGHGRGGEGRYLLKRRCCCNGVRVGAFE